MIPAPRTPADDIPARAFAAQQMVFYTCTVSPGCNDNGPAFATYRATVTATPASVPAAQPASTSAGAR